VTRGGNVEGATHAFEQLLAYANDVALFAEEIDSHTSAALGNFPQAFTHIGLINAPLTLDEYREGNAPATAERPPNDVRTEDLT
jgi:GH15 family glucan-1,4-alpha-glucosidase